MSHSGERPVALVTGANRGIGKEVARGLAGRGFDVILSARDVGEAQRAADEITREHAATVLPLALDVSEPESIQAAAGRIHTEPGRLDVLVNNAGIGTDFGVPGTAPDFQEMERELRTNFYGAYRLTVELLGLLRASAHPRVVNVSSGMGAIAEMGGFSPVYRVSKAAMNAMSRILSAELAGEGFLVNSACEEPGGRRVGDHLARDAPGRRADRRLLPRRHGGQLLSRGSRA